MPRVQVLYQQHWMSYLPGVPRLLRIIHLSSAVGRVSWIGRINYSYLDRYMVETILRADASSRFAKGHRWGYFPSVSLGWNMAEETFMKQLNFVDNLKIRLSYGESGYDAVANFAYLTGYTFDSSYTLGSGLISGLTPSGLPNINLTWERMKIYNAGVDYSLWNRKLYGDAEFFTANVVEFREPARVLYHLLSELRYLRKT